MSYNSVVTLVVVKVGYLSHTTVAYIFGMNSPSIVLGILVKYATLSGNLCSVALLT